MGESSGVVKDLRLVLHGTADPPAHLRLNGGRRDYGDVDTRLRAVKVRTSQPLLKLSLITSPWEQRSGRQAWVN